MTGAKGVVIGGKGESDDGEGWGVRDTSGVVTMRLIGHFQHFGLYPKG